MKDQNFINEFKKRTFVKSSIELHNFIYKIFDENKIITFLNPYSYLVYRRNINLFTKYDFLLSDGIVLVKILKLFKIVNTLRLSFDMTSLANMVFNLAEKNNYTTYLIGSELKAIEMAQKKISNKFPDLKILGYRSGYFINKYEMENAIEVIVNLNPKLVIVGMGSGLQEKFLIELRNNGWKGSGFTCGNFYYQVSKKLHYYPYLFDKFNLRAFYRMFKEPKLIFRYFIYYPMGINLFLYDIIRYKIKNKVN